MMKKLGIGSQSSQSSSATSTADSATFISALTTDDIPDMRDDSVQLVIPQPKAKQSRDLPPRPKPLKMKIKTQETSFEEPKIYSPPSGATAKSQPIKSPDPSIISSPPSSVSPSDAPSVHVSVYTAQNVEFVATKLASIPHLLVEEILSDSDKLVEDAIDRLARRCRKSDEIRDEAYRAGGHAIIVMVMRRWRDNELIQAGGCRCITNMTCQFPDAKRSFAMIGGVESAIVAMQTYPDSQQVQGYGCGALMNILCGHTDETADVSLAMAHKFVNELDGIAIVVRAMQAFPDDTKIQLGGCGLFQNLAQNKSFIYSMMQEGAVAAVGSSLAAHPSDPNIKKAAGSFMKKVFA